MIDSTVHQADQAGLRTIEGRLDKIEGMLAALVERQTGREWYSTEEFAHLVRRAEFTVREWCRHGRIRAVKKDSGRGPHAGWAISHEELQRYQKEGLLRGQRTGGLAQT